MLLTFHFRVFRLWKLNAVQFVQDHVVCMYMLLPAMKGANASLLLQAISEMEQYYQWPQLGHHLTRFRTILLRSKTISRQDQQEVEKKLHTFDSLLDQDPYIQEKIALERAIERNESIQAFQDTIIEIVKTRFPNLAELAQQRVVQIRELDDLKRFIIQLSTAPNQTAVRRILKNSLQA